MINLLPFKNKEELKKEKEFKLVFIAGIIILSSLVCFCLILVSIKILISSEIETQKIFYQQKEKEFKDSNLQILEDKILVSNKKITEIEDFYKKQISLINLLEEISGVIPSEIYIHNLNLNFLIIDEKQKYLAQISLLGFSPTRESLIDFKNKLEKEENIAEVNFPSGVWLKSTDIDFSVDFKIKEVNF